MSSSSPRRALIWALAERYASLVISLGSTLVLARLLTPQQVGIYSMCAAFTAVAGILRDFGVSEYLVQEKELTRERVRAAQTVALVVAWVIGACVYASRPLVVAFYGEPQLADVLAVLALNFFLLPLGSPAMALMTRDMQFRTLFIIQIISTCTQAAVAVLLAWHGHGPLSLAWGPVAGIVMQMLLLLGFRPKDMLTLPGLREWRRVLGFGSLFAGTRVVETFTRNVHEMVIGKRYDFASVGLFSRAFGLIELFTSNVSSAVVRVAAPTLAALARQGLPLAEPFKRSASIFVSLHWTIFGYIALMAEPIIRLLFGPQWLPAAPIASILALTLLPSGLVALMPQLLIATGHLKMRTRITMWASALHLVAVLVLAQVSVKAVALSWLLSSVFSVVMYLRTARAVLQVSPQELMRALASGCAVALVALGTMGLTRVLALQLGVPGWLQLPGVLLLGLMGWLGAALWLRHPAAEECQRAYRLLLKR